MRRLLAYSFDLLIFLPLVYGLWYIAEKITQSAINLQAFHLIFLPCFISIFEYYFDGKTPGKFLMRLRTVSENNQRLSLMIFYKRCALITYLYPVTTICLIVIFEIILNLRLYGLANSYSFLVFLIFLAVPAIITFGSQSGHDYVFKTAVISDSNESIRKLSGKHANIIVIFLIILIVGVVYSINVNRDRIFKIATETGITQKAALIEKALMQLVPETNILERNVDNFYDFYGDQHFFEGSRDLVELDQDIGIQTPPLLTFSLNEHRYIPVAEVAVTLNGLINNRFQEAVTRNILGYFKDKAGTDICMVEYVYQVNVFGLFSLIIGRSNIGVYTGINNDTGLISSMVFRPKISSSISIFMPAMPEHSK